MNNAEWITSEIRNELIEFTQSLVRIKSFSGKEEEIVRFIAKKMKTLGYDEVTIDAMGNVVGRIGYVKKAIMLDSHIDTVAVTDEDKWQVPPFSGNIVDGCLYGRGSVDMKSGAAASIYAGAIAKKEGLDPGKSIYVSCSVYEEDCDGENLKHIFKAFELKPNYMIICEPSANIITLGHKGKAQMLIKTLGLSAHGSAPEKGLNAIYEMAEIIQRVEKLNLELRQTKGSRGTLVMSKISSSSESLNAVPATCEVYLDRRLAVGETKETIKNEMDQIIKDKKATWELGTLKRKSWTGLDIKYEPFHLAWEIDLNHELTRTLISAYQDSFGSAPHKFDFWDFSTNAVTPVSMGIPTIGFGPGEYKLAHMDNEHCKVHQIVAACHLYSQVIQKL